MSVGWKKRVLSRPGSAPSAAVAAPASRARSAKVTRRSGRPRSANAASDLLEIGLRAAEGAGGEQAGLVAHVARGQRHGAAAHHGGAAREGARAVLDARACRPR